MANMTFKTNLLPNSTTQEYSLGSSTNKWKIYGDLIGNAEKVTQNNQDGAAEYRILLSGSANNTNEFNVTNKSGNLTFNPSTKLLSIGGGITATGDLTLAGSAHLNSETYADSLTAGSLLVTGNSNFTQIPTAPTPVDSSNDTSVATTAFVKKAFSYNDAMVFMGAVAGGSSMPAANKGHTYRVSSAGKINGQYVEVGDTLICTEDNTAAGNTTNWIILQTNIDGAVVGPASSTTGHIATFTGTTGKAIKDSGFTIATSVPGNAVFTDTKVTQGTTTTSSWRKILLNGGSGTIYSAWNTEVGNDVTDIAYRTLGVSVQPSTNTLKANNLYAARAFNNLITGTGTAAKDNGSGDNRYMPAKWTFNTGTNVTDGEIYTIKIPVAGHDYGVFMSVNNGTNYYPVVCNGTGRVTTHYPVNTYLQVIFESTGSAASMFPLAGGTSRVTVSNGVFRVINYYDSNSNDTGYYHRKIYPNLKAGANKIFPYTLIMQNKDGRWESIVTSSSTGTSKAKNTHGFLLEQVWCMYANTTYNENGNVGTYNIWTAHSGLIDMRYSINVTTSSGMTGYKPVYLVGTIGTDGLFYLADTWWSQTLPTTDDGKVYVYIGDAYDAYRITLSEVNTAYFFRDNRLQMYGSGRGVKGISRSGTTFTVTRDDGSTFTFTQQDNNSVTGVKGNAESSYRTGNVNLTPANIGAVNKAGDTMTGVLTALGSQYADSYSGALNMNNSNIYGLNSIYTADTSDNAAEGIHFYRDSTHVDTLWMNGGDLLFVPNRTLGTSTTKADSQKVGRFTTNPTSGQVVITDGTTGGMKSSGFTIAASVPSGAKFTDTTYTANNGVSLSGTTFSNSGVRATTINGNYLRVNTNGTNADLTIPYATESKNAANTQSNFGAKSFIVEGDADTYYPTLFTGYTAHNAWTLLNISRGYSEQAPDTWNTSTHKGGLTLTILSNGDSAWGGNHNIGVTKLNTIFDLSQDYCTMVGDIECTNFGLVIWLRGGTAKYWVTSNGGHEVSVTTYYESHTQSSNTVTPITTVNTSRIDSYRWNNLWNINTANKLKTARTIQTNLASTSSASFDGSDNITPGVVGTLGIANGGTGATTVANARTNLGLGTMATETATDYLKLSGGTMTGPIKFPTEASAYTNGIRFLNGTEERGSIGVDDNGIVGIFGSTKISLRPVLNTWTDGVEITTSSMIPTKDNTVSLGTSGKKWSNVYATTFTGNLTGNASTATKATQDESGNNIKASYASSFSISEHTITLKNKNGESLGSVTVPNYTFTNGNGSFTITSSEGNVQTVSIGKPATAGVADSANSVAWGNITGKPSSYTPSSHSHSEIVTVGDKRSEATTPNSYANKIIFQGLKTNSSFGSPSTDNYSYVIGLRGWSDSSGGDSHELAFNNTGLYWRHGATTSWGNWNRLVTNSGTWGISITGNAATATKFASAQSITLTGDVTGTVSSQAGWSIATTIGQNKVTNNMLAGSITNAKLSNSKVTIAGNDVSLGGSITADTLRTSLGLSNAMHFKGTTTTTMSDGLTTAAVTIGGASYTPSAGDVVLYSDSEFVWTGSAWERLGRDSSFKTTQSAVTTATAETTTATTFVYSVTQDANGVITVKTRPLPTYNNYSLPTASTSTKGGIKVGSGLTMSSETLNHTNSVTAKTSYGSTATTASANGGTIIVTDIKYDAQGHITASTDRTITLSQTTYGAEKGISLSSGKFGHSNTSITAKTAAAQAAKTLTWGGTFTLYEEKYDTYGHITGVASYNMTMPSNPNTDTKQNITLATTSKAYITGVTTTPTASATAMTGVADTDVYLTTTAGQLNAKTYLVDTHVILQYDSALQALEFAFV